MPPPTLQSKKETEIKTQNKKLNRKTDQKHWSKTFFGFFFKFYSELNVLHINKQSRYLKTTRVQQLKKGTKSTTKTT